MRVDRGCSLSHPAPFPSKLCHSEKLTKTENQFEMRTYYLRVFNEILISFTCSRVSCFVIVALYFQFGLWLLLLVAMATHVQLKLNCIIFFVLSLFSTHCSPQSNYTSPWHWTTVTATGEWHTEARKEPNPSAADLASFLPSNSDFHNFHHLMSGGNLLGGHKNRVNSLPNAKQHQQHQTQAPPPSTMPSSLGHSTTHQSGIPISPGVSTSMMPNAGAIALPPPAPTPLPSQHTSTSNSNAMLSPRHLPFPYNMTNFHHTGY